jgi:hypothetical protein
MSRENRSCGVEREQVIKLGSFGRFRRRVDVEATCPERVSSLNGDGWRLLKDRLFSWTWVPCSAGEANRITGKFPELISLCVAREKAAKGGVAVEITSSGSGRHTARKGER